jgi:integrase
MPKKYRSVDRDVHGFCGWDFLQLLISKCLRDEEKLLISTLFETGGRIGEVLKLRRENFVDKGDFIVVDSMSVEKRREVAYRTFPIPKHEPLAKVMLDGLSNVRDFLFDFNRVTAFNMVRRVGKRVGDIKVPFSSIKAFEIHPHWFRAMRAAQLKSEYDFDAFSLASFFGWKLPQFGAIGVYTRLTWEELARRMRRGV